MKALLWQRQVWMLPISIFALGAAVALIGVPTRRADEQPQAFPSASVAVWPASVPPGPHSGWEIDPNATAYTDDDRPPTF